MTIRAIAAVALCAAACGPMNSSDSYSEDFTARKGIDYAWGRPRPSVLHADGYTFAARYLSYDTTGKNLSHAEADALRAAGVDVVANWEWGASDALNGYNEGVTHARAADQQAQACGQPSGRPIYFSVDFDATPGDQTAIDAYFDGVASVIGRARTGAYGGYWVIKRLFDAGKIKYGWQTYAWSGGNWDPRAQIRQVQNGIYVDGVGSDRDESEADDFGQWGYSAAPPPPPPPPPSSAGSGQRIVAGENADGRIEVFHAASGGELGHEWEQTQGGWSQMVSLGGAARSLAIANDADGRLELFYVGTNGALYHNWQDAPNGNWRGEAALGGDAKQVVVGRNADGRLEVFYIGSNDALYHNWQTAPNGAWFGQAALGGYAKELAVAPNADGRLEVVYVGTNDAIYHNFQTAPNGDWFGEIHLGGSAKRVALARNADGRLEAFYVGTNDALYHNWQTAPNGNWSGEAGLGGFAKELAVGRNHDGRLELFYIGTNEVVYHNWQTSPNSGWSGEAQF